MPEFASNAPPPRPPTASALLLAVLLAAPASATTVRGFTLAGLVRESAVVVRGVVEGSQSFWNSDHTRIYTDTAVRVTDVLAGRAPVRIRVRQLGGRVGQVTARVVGTAPLRPGDDVVLFLRAQPGFYTLVGMAQGRFRVERRGARAVVTRSLSGLTVVQRLHAQPIGRFPRITGRPPPTYEAFRAEVRRLAGAR